MALGLGMGLGLGSSLASIAQSDAIAYANLLIANGGTNTYANGSFTKDLAFRQQLYGIAGQPVEYFNLRSGYNMGSGTIAYGSLGTPATLFNSLTWGTTGLTSGAGGGFIMVAQAVWNPITGSQVHTKYFAGKNVTGGILRGVSFGAVTASGLSEIQTCEGAHTFNTAPYTPDYVAIEAFSETWCFVSGAYDSTRCSILLDSGSVQQAVTEAGNIVASNLYIGSRDGTQNMPTGSIISFGCVSRSFQTEAQMQAIRSTYKSTIGQGLALP